MFGVAQWFSKNHNTNLIWEPVRNAVLRPYLQTSESEILGMRPNDLFYQVFQMILVPVKVWETLFYVGKVEIQDTCGPGDRKPLLLPVSGKNLHPPETCFIGYTVLTHQINSLYLMEESVKELTSSEAKVESWEEENSSKRKELAVHLYLR